MDNNSNPAAKPSSILYTMLRVGDLDRSLTFYCDILGMREIRRETFSDARFTLVFVGYDRTALIELTYNWGENSYTHGNGYGHIALRVVDIHAVCKRLLKLGVEIIRAPGPMTVAPDETGEREIIAFIIDPDGYRIELIETN